MRLCLTKQRNLETPSVQPSLKIALVTFPAVPAKTLLQGHSVNCRLLQCTLQANQSRQSCFGGNETKNSPCSCIEISCCKAPSSLWEELWLSWSPPSRIDFRMLPHAPSQPTASSVAWAKVASVRSSQSASTQRVQQNGLTPSAWRQTTYKHSKGLTHTTVHKSHLKAT